MVVMIEVSDTDLALVEASFEPQPEREQNAYHTWDQSGPDETPKSSHLLDGTWHDDCPICAHIQKRGYRGQGKMRSIVTELRLLRRVIADVEEGKNDNENYVCPACRSIPGTHAFNCSLLEYRTFNANLEPQ
jgi:hypothetical protein